MDAPPDDRADEEFRATLRGCIAVAVAMMVIGGLAAGIGVAMAAHGASTGHPRTASASEPAFSPALLPASVASTYRYVAGHRDLVAGMPCFCGCEAFLRHRLTDCFLRGAGWEPHASGCGVCTSEAEMVRAMSAEGASMAAIRDSIVERFSPLSTSTGA
jgi:hypothetical protein